jgi:hypothetical protein
VKALALAPDGRTIAASSLAGLFLFDAASSKRVPEPAQQVLELLGVEGAAYGLM